MIKSYIHKFITQPLTDKFVDVVVTHVDVTLQGVSKKTKVVITKRKVFVRKCYTVLSIKWVMTSLYLTKFSSSYVKKSLHKHYTESFGNLEFTRPQSG